MISSSGTNHKIIEQSQNSLQFHPGTMIINIIAFLLLAGGALSSLPVHGSISIIDDDAISINLHANKSSVGDDLDDLIKKLKIENIKPRIHLHLGKKIIEIINGTDHEQDCFETNNINEILRRATLSIRESGRKEIHQDSLQHEDLQRFIIPQRYQNSMNFDQEFEYTFSQILSDVKLALESERLNSRSELLFEYTKSIQDSLLWLTKLLDLKWQRLYNDFDNSFRWRLLNLQKQSEFFLKNLIKENQYVKKREHSEDILKDESKNGISNEKKINVKKITILNGENIKNLDKIEINKNKTQETNKNITDDKLAFKVEARIMSHPQLLNDINIYDFENKNHSSQNVLINKSVAFQTDLNNRKNSKTNNSGITHKFFTTNFEDYRNRFNEAKKRRPILSDDKKQEIDVSKKKTESNSREEIKEARIDGISAMDEILGAVDKVLPTENPVEILSRGLKKTIPRMS
ncbi:uncharacterized protein LOC109609939 isoform X2 [Camponotus floridanus]|uniref:uncharacterized protein LOC109609939 isoform X2 n=1 Tax=Camponotus floridanus TaxID=104421 RepID=UPI000DC6C13D|nr:uncharacterized protein LOC109609939 isoform X2 [Camponotus floridanus]